MKQQLNLYIRKSIILCAALLCCSLPSYTQSGEWVPQNIFEGGGSTNIFEANPQGSMPLSSDTNLFGAQGNNRRDSLNTRNFDPNLYGNSDPGGPGTGGGGGTPDDAGVPVDGGLSVIVVVGVAMGLRRQRTSQHKDIPVK